MYEDYKFWEHLLNHPEASWTQKDKLMIYREHMPFDLWTGGPSMAKDVHNQRHDVRHELRLVFSVCRNGLMYEARGRPWARWNSPEGFMAMVHSWAAMQFPIGPRLAHRPGE